MRKKVLFLDRDGTIVTEPSDYQLDDLNKLQFLPGVFKYLSKMVEEFDFELVMITNQDGLGTDSFPASTFWPVQNKIIQFLAAESIEFKEIIIDRTFAAENLPTRKPGTALLSAYFSKEYDLEQSYVIGDRITDMVLAQNLGSKGIWINATDAGVEETIYDAASLSATIQLKADNWASIYSYLNDSKRQATIRRNTKETQIEVQLNLDGQANASINTGISFFDHMLEQLARHAQLDLILQVKGDLEVDEHHTIEDTAIALGTAFKKALGNKKGIERYGFCLPMDDCLAQVALDFGGRNWLVWEADFHREMIGKMPTEMFFHFFKSFSDAAACNLNIQAWGQNEHHKIEAIFKAWARAIKMAIKQDKNNQILPSTKGVI